MPNVHQEFEPFVILLLTKEKYVNYKKNTIKT